MNKINYFILLICLSWSTYSVELVRCHSKLYTRDYLLLKDRPPFGELWEDVHLDPKNFFAYHLVFQVIYHFFSGELEDDFQLFNNNFMKSRKRISWQPSELGFSSTKIDGVKSGLPMECWGRDRRVEILTSVKRTIQGGLLAYEYDEKLISELKKDNTQYSFFRQGMFLREYVKDRHNLSTLNYFVHWRSVMTTDVAQGRAMLKRLGLIQGSIVNVCDRSHLLINSLQKIIGLPCEEINLSDLASVRKLELENDDGESGKHSDGDFNGLSNLTNIVFTKYNRSIMDISYQDIRSLKSLKSLTINESDIPYFPSNFRDNVQGLTNLDLSNNNISEIKIDMLKNAFIELERAPARVTLDLSNNHSARARGYLHPGSFNGCEAVTDLNLANMNLKVLKKGVFDSFKRLKVLNLSRNPIRGIEKTLKSIGLSELTELDLSRLPFDKLPEDTFNHMKKLKVLRLKSYNLKEFPRFLFNIENLEDLTFCSKYISSQDVFSALKKIKPSLQYRTCQFDER